MRVAARLLASGNMEFALQQRQEGIWGDRQLPARRFIAGDAQTDRRIQAVAADRGYRPQPVVTSTGELVSVGVDKLTAPPQL